MQKDFILRPGPLNSFNSLTFHLGPQLSELRKEFLQGETPNVILDLRYLSYERIQLSALASLLSICRRISIFIRKPIETLFTWNTRVQGYLAHVQFFQIAKERNILIWDDRMVGGYGTDKYNPDTTLLVFGHVLNSYKDLNNKEIEALNKYRGSIGKEKIAPDFNFDNLSPNEISIIKPFWKEKIGPNFLLRCRKIFEGFDPKLRNVIANTSLELITNCLIHAKDFAFVGLKRTSNKISVSVCDSGIGFIKSLRRSYPEIKVFENLDHSQAIYIGSLIQISQHGLRLAINDVIGYDEFQELEPDRGWVIISSFDSEIRWEKYNWHYALSSFQFDELISKLPNLNQIFGPPSFSKIPKEDLYKGYWKKHDRFLTGSRISFEIPIQRLNK